jgi:CBS domain-containing protein
MITVNEVMSTEIITLKVSDSVSAARKLMRKENIRHIPIVTEHLSPVGIVTQRDLLRAQVSVLTGDNNQAIDENLVPVEQIMSSKIAFVHPDDSLRSAGLKIQKHKYGCLPVVDNNQLVGIITDSDFVSVAIDLIEQMEYTEDL